MSFDRHATSGAHSPAPSEGDGRAMSDQQLHDPPVNIRTSLALLWVCHFILWIFGDMFALLQDLSEPVTEATFMFVAPTVIVLVLMVVLCLMGRPAHVRLANLVVAPLYLLLDIGFMVEASEGWQYYLGVFYLLFIGLIIWRSYAWSKSG